MVSYLKVPLGNLQELDALGRVNDLSGEDLMCLNGTFLNWPLAARGQTSAKLPRIGLLWHEASTEEAVIYLGADLSCRQNATHSRDIDWLLNHPLGRPCP